MSTQNTWPQGIRRALEQDEHERWNSYNYPGTLELCCDCGEVTGRCDEDNIFTEKGHGPLCIECWKKTEEYILSSNE